MTMKTKLYVHKQEVWDDKECERKARYAPKDAWGNRPPKGIISQSGSPYVQYGKTVRFNGGCIRDEKWYEGETMPMPSIPENYEIVPLTAWGLIIRKKKAWIVIHLYNSNNKTLT